MTNEEKVAIERSYIDNYSIKEFITNNLVQKYFPDIDVSLRTIGTVGMMSELISNIAEDSFNATSVLFREAFPNRAEFPESIYSHASIFQLSNIFSKASACSFLIVIEEDSIINNMTYDVTSGMYYFFIDKNTTVYVEDVPYVLDYDIRIRCVKKKTSNSENHIFTASYILDEYTNSISDIQDPYIRIRRSSNGYLALEVKMHQVVRDVQYESIVSNSKINMPIIDIPFDGQLVGFDVLYKSSDKVNYSTQMQKLLVYSQPIKQPFCYYQLYNDNILRLSFNSKDSYFSPEFNSSLKIILYLSNGKDANFDVYTGNNITIKQDNSVYSYENSIDMAAKPLSGSYGGDDRLALDELQALTIESYRTALSLTTEDDLSAFFSNYKYTYGDFAIKFIKRRNDVYERIFAGYCIMKYESEIFKTNTLDISMNLSDMENPETNIYMIEPGTLFTYNDDDTKSISFMRDQDKYDTYYAEYQQAITDGTIPYIVNADETVPEYLRTRNASFAEFKARKGYKDRLNVFDLSENKLNEFNRSKFMFINPFLIKFKKSPNLVSLYQTYIDFKSTVDFTNQNDNAFVQFVDYQVQIQRVFNKTNEYTITTSIMPSISLDNEYPVIARIGKNKYNEDVYNVNNRYNLDQNDVRVLFVIYDEGNPICYSEMYPTEFIDETNITYETKFSTDNHITSDNKLRLKQDISYLVIDVDDILSDEDYSYFTTDLDIHNGWCFKVADGDNTKYDIYDESDNLVKAGAVKVDEITSMNNRKLIKKYSKLVQISNYGGDILIPMENVKCKIFTLYRRKYVENGDTNEMVLTDHSDTDNIFIYYDGTMEEDYTDSTYDTYIWTNEYTTGLQPLTFIKPLNHVRSNLYFEDYTIEASPGTFTHDIMDVRMESVPFVKWDLAYDTVGMASLMSQFNTHYDNINEIINNRLRNETSIDFKFYNTYGKSINYYIGDDANNPLDTLNLRIYLDIWFVAGTDTLMVIPEIKQFIKERIETVTNNGTNQIHVSNLMKDIEQAFTYIDHIRFRRFNDYDTYYQSIKPKYDNLDKMSKEERRRYVPELLVINLDDIHITEYTVN